ncbi:MAG: imidazole glycerol phosphate synthase subunit HisH [Candidatus Altiarchaeales archaeon]|nr:imidazole glycerol phosphate synthase subunit HisH [Candidatus Altiarchaeales archaeon]MBD3415979.1 imidazole glycerol phosphate synthase subunit HisH [Candidatus Altiarchaeales archaeon]
MIAVIDYGAGNLRSISNGLRKVGADLKLVEDPGMIGDADGIVLPGVGAFGDAMEKVKAFKPSIEDAVDSGTPFLGVCLGIQLIFESSEENPGVGGLGLFRGTCRKFTGGLKVPHMGWNTVRRVRETPLLEGVEDGSYFYFVHSYHVMPNSVWVVAGETEYGRTFPSVISEGNVHATQFHPEKSGDNGLRILENFRDECRR